MMPQPEQEKINPLIELLRLQRAYEFAASPDDDSAGADEAAELSNAVGRYLVECGYQAIV